MIKSKRILVIAGAVMVFSLVGCTTESLEDLSASLETQAKKEYVTPTKTESNLTMGQKNALAKAQQYLKTMPFSYEGLVKQLEYEKFSEEDARFAAENCGANWNEQAAKKAKQYLQSMSFSRESLKNQLLYEKFTEEQAEYGVTQVGY